MARSMNLYAAILAAALPVGAAAAAEQVDLALVLAVDVSRSMDPDEQRVQRDGYVAAFRDREIIAAIRTGLYGKIAVTYVEWSGFTLQTVTVPWRVLSDEESVLAFAAELAAAPITLGERTSISGGLIFAASLFDQSGVDAAARTIDISGDGANNDGGPVASAKRRVAARGITVNGLPILIRPTTYSYGPPFGPFSLDAYYKECVITGPGAFTVSVTSADGFYAAIRRKLVLEIAGARPEVFPASARLPQRTAVDCLIGERMLSR
jgi:hypothetical protein